MNIKEIEGVLLAIEEADCDENPNAATDLMNMATVKLLADIAIKMDKLVRLMTARVGG